MLDQRAIRQRARRRQALLSLFIVVLLGFFAVAFVHAELVADQYELDGIRARIAEAEAHNAKVARAVEEASSPASIVERATGELGMVRSHQPVYLAAAVPVRDIPDTISFSGRRDQAPAIVAPATAAGLDLAGGVSGTATVNVETTDAGDPGTAVAAPGVSSVSAAPAANQAVVVEQAGSLSGSQVSVATGQTQPTQAAQTQTASPSQAPVVAGASVGGAAPSISAGAGSSSSPVAGAAVGGTAVGTQTSIAGTRAVSAGQQPQVEDPNRLGGTNAGTGSG